MPIASPKGMPTPTGFYRDVLSALQAAKIPFLVGGAYAFCRHVGIDRGTKDLDLLICKDDWRAAAQALRARHIVTRLVFPHWLGKALGGKAQVDIIFSGGNGLTIVTRDWFTFAVPAKVLGHNVCLCAAEELLWSKAFVMERERYDGNEVLHLIRALADRMDWKRVVRRFTGHELLLHCYLLLFKYVYPGEAHRVPPWVEPALAHAAADESAPPNLCRGTLLSRAQYLVDLEEWGYLDARRPPFGRMIDAEWLKWTNAIDPHVSRVRAHRRTRPPRTGDGDTRRHPRGLQRQMGSETYAPSTCRNAVIDGTKK